jgi:hypothetical protein
MAEVSVGVYNALERSKVIDTLGRENVYKATPVIGGSIDDALEASTIWIEETRAASTSGDPAEDST